MASWLDRVPTPPPLATRCHLYIRTLLRVNSSLSSAKIVSMIYSGCLQFTGSDTARCTVANLTAADSNTVGTYVSSNTQYSVFILCGSDFRNASNQVPSKFQSNSFILMDSRSDVISTNLISVDFACKKERRTRDIRWISR